MSNSNPFTEPFTINGLAQSVAADFGIPIEVLLGRERGFEAARARSIIAQFCKDRGMSSTQIGKRLGRDHATVLYSWKQFPMYLQYYPLVRVSYEKHCILRRIAGES